MTNCAAATGKNTWSQHQRVDEAAFESGELRQRKFFGQTADTRQFRHQARIRRQRGGTGQTGVADALDSASDGKHSDRNGVVEIQSAGESARQYQFRRRHAAVRLQRGDTGADRGFRLEQLFYVVFSDADPGGYLTIFFDRIDKTPEFVQSAGDTFVRQIVDVGGAANAARRTSPDDEISAVTEKVFDRPRFRPC